MKSTVDEIRARFDADVERFANLETGQTATIDAPLALELIAQAAAASTPHARQLLDIGCGAGNYSLKLLERLPQLEVTLIDLSQPMLQRATERLETAGCGRITPRQTDIREFTAPAEFIDIIVAAAVLHHLRSDEEWEAVFANLYRTLAPGGSLWIFDLLMGDNPLLHNVAWQQYGEYLTHLGGEAYRDKVFAYIEREDTPRSLTYQLRLLDRVGFQHTEVLHKHGPFAAFGAIKPR